MLDIKYLIKLVTDTAEGRDSFKEGAVGCNGYGFVFRSHEHNSRSSLFTATGSSKIFSFGVFKNIYEKFTRDQDKLISIERLLNYDSKLDLFFGGALKSLIPDLEFGGNELLFSAWILVKTPKNQIFPITFYYGQSGTSIGGWSLDHHPHTEEEALSQGLKSHVNSSPFNLSHKELEEFIEALECSLSKVPISDFEGIFIHDLGKVLMGIKSGKPFTENLKTTNTEAKKKIDTWSYSILGNDEAMSYLYEYIRVIMNYLTTEEENKYPKKVPNDLKKILIERCYNNLVDHAYRKGSRLAYLVLGLFLMSRSARITDDLKQKILKYSDWKYEKNQLKNKKDRNERKSFLAEFREKISHYDGTQRVNVPLYTITRIINEKKVKEDKTSIWRQNIDYIIKE